VQFLPLVVFLAIAPIVVLLMVTFDRLVRIEFEEFPLNWVADGKPYPLLWRKPDMPRTIGSWFATQRCALDWACAVPAWAEGHAEASRYARRLRVLFVLWVGGAMPLFVASGIVAAAFN
jgi:hypothetical protein